MNKYSKRTGMRKLVAFALVLAMLLTLMPVSAFAKWPFWPAWSGRTVEAPAAQAEPEPEAPEAAAEEPAAEAPAEEESETPVEASAEEAAPAIVEELKVDDLTVSIDAEEGAFPEGAEVQAEKVDIADVQKAVDESEDVSGKVLVAVDITFTKDGAELQPAEGKAVKVNISAPALKDVAEDATVVHIDSETKEAQVVETVDAPAADEVAFEADSFSVYAVLGDNATGEDARRAVEFYNGDTLVATMYVREADPAEPAEGETVSEREKILYDPGVGALEDGAIFRGWSTEPDYDNDTEALDIEEIRRMAYTGPIVEGGEPMRFYAMIFEAYQIVFMDEQYSAIHSDVVLMREGGSADYTIDTNYVSTDPDANFVGWDVLQGDVEPKDPDVEAPYPVGTELTVSSSVAFIANAPKGNWLVFYQNGAGASYTSPQFLQETDPTEEPAKEPTRHGYTFGGWYETPECDGEPFEFGGTISERTPLYAKWDKNTEAEYAIIVWKQRMSDTYAAVQNGAEKQYDFAGAVTGTGEVGKYLIADLGLVEQTGAAVTEADGTSYKNAVVDGEEKAFQGYHCASIDEDVAITPEGSAVLNVYYDRNTVTYSFYTYGYTYTPTTGNSGTQYGIVNGDYQEVYYNSEDGKWYSTKNEGACSGTTYDDEYTGTRYTRSSGQRWNEYSSMTGFYGESLNWPDDTSIAWYPNGYSDGSTSGTRMTYKANFLPNDSEMNVSYYGRSNSNTAPVRFYTQDVNGRTYTLQKTVAIAGSGTFSINDKFSGFYASQYRSGNGSWNDIDPATYDPDTGIYGEAVYYSSSLDIRYDRKSFDLVFKDGAYFSGQNGEVHETEVTPYNGVFQVNGEDAVTEYYGSDISSYASFAPETTYNEGYTFVGWYADKTCTQPYPFTTMPDGGVTVYAKWVKSQYRVFLHPNADGDESLDWGGNQDMNFRVTYGENVNNVFGLRKNYELIGWYKDKDLLEPFNSEYIVMTDDNVPEIPVYNKSVDMTDEMDKFGNIVDASTAFNSDVNRPWVTRKLDLYAKWRATLVGADGINVVYDVGDSDSEINDPLTYLDATWVFAQAASTPRDENKQFLHWVIQTWGEDENGEEGFQDTDKFVYPGDTFEVLLANARTVELEGSTPEKPKFEYTVQLRAEYTDRNVPTNTHIDWYGNGGKTANGEEVVKDEGLQINEKVEIRGADTFTRDGYRFLGWAKLNEGSEPDDDTEPWLYYADGSFYLDPDDESSVVTHVAADEVKPYQNLYALWEGNFNVVYYVANHDNEPVEYTIPFSALDEDGKYNIIDGTDEYPGVDFDAYLYGGYQKLNDEGEREYCTEYGYSMTPEAGQTYYVKQIPVTDKYLNPFMRLLQRKKTGVVTDMWVLSSVDDLNYTSTGFIINETRKTATGIRTQVTILNNQGEGVTITRKNAFVGSADLPLDGYMTYYTFPEITAGATYGVVPFWVTFDNVLVQGRVSKTIEMNSDGTLKSNTNAAFAAPNRSADE